MHDVWVEVDLGALRHNLRQVRGVVGESVKVMAVVKANGYGHGYVEPSRAFVEAGADALAVTRVEEALAIRQAGITAPILLLAPIQPANAADAIAADLEMAITDIGLAQAISDTARIVGRTARVHVKVDTGMGRFGLAAQDVPAFVNTLTRLPSIEIAGVFTHFATATEPNLTPSRNQLELFRRVLDGLREMGFHHGLAHAANSAAILRLPESRLDMVRCGTLLYGQSHSRHVHHRLDLKPTWKLKARICQIRELPPSTPIGYGAEFVTRRHTRAAVIPVGYADGFTLAPEGPIYRQSTLGFALRKLRRTLAVELRGKKVRVLGRVAMQTTVIDVTSIEGASVGDEVTVPAMRIPTSALVPRIYLP